ncbi:IucA/IucC family siderophore biosynthesis protein [Streptacidiphilus sp. P02-A3a]|uniref:IucA/IucC family protein n=1 Tax=Streptacidiphilus sp. P02-A3a TaxID=2704468 RepID=UPI0015F813FB|nr:IucA/IucC family protein [Streptacidiphilus sp. P02-A3a]QMU72226.1 siderophore biosynthesis protein [Streptacidiphilus sp. P02-A3a]
MSTAAASGLPAQTRAVVASEPEDPLLHPDAAVAADCAGTENLLRCWVRETGLVEPPDGTLRVALGDGLTLSVPVRHWSATGWHRFGRARLGLDRGPDDNPTGGAGHPVDAVTVSALLARAAAATDPAATDGGSPRHTAELAGRVADSVRRTARFLTDRRDTPQPTPGTSPFLATEQDLLLGHPLHPTPKSREGLGEAETAAYSPELRGAYRLHWFGVHRALLAQDSALSRPSAGITADLARDLAPDLPPDTVALPLHPWQARELSHRAEVRALLDDGRLRDLGPSGPPWYPTSSVRTVYRPDSPWMLKLSLGLAITNSRRENLRKELHRGLEVHRLLEAGLGREWRAAHPRFDIVRDPAWIGVDLPVTATDDGPGGRAAALPGLDTVIRLNPFGPGDRAHCVAGLVAGTPVGSRLGALLRRLAARTGRPTATVAAEWFRRYLDAVVLPVLWLDGQAGIALEAHQQNSLVLLDAHGWPEGGRYRDNQGYYFRDSHADALRARLPGIGAQSDTFVPDAVADERFGYYLGINHLLGLIGAFGAQRLADERVLLAALRRFLSGRGAAASGSGLPELLLDAPVLRCKANLLTRLGGLDELVGPVATQSVYVDLANPLAAVDNRRTAGATR